MITKEQADRWLADLRSGKFKQGRRCLYRPEDNSYCCLGVLAYSRGDDLKECGCHAQLDGLPFAQHLQDDEDIQIDLYRKNDDGDKSFSEIADYIESKYYPIWFPAN